ncbi:MAG: hypothetical protein D6750_01495 [Bacteroidetes bacterium]|nr:MAG: hypothetical protein D6750_01495 [Bacteroidota bacterium]
MSVSLIQQAVDAYEDPLVGENLPASTLRGVLSAYPVVWLQFLRHLGCIYCKGLVTDIRDFLAQWTDRAPFLVFVHPNTLEEGQRFFQVYYPGAAHIADPTLRLYRLFRVRRASLLSEIHPRNLLRGLTLLRRGFTNEKPTADPWILHATFLFHEGNLIWSYYARRLSDVPTWRRLF